MYYRLYDMTVQSNIEFPQLYPCEFDNECELKIDIEISVIEGNKLQKRFSDILEKDGNWGFTENGLWFSNNAGVLKDLKVLLTV